MRTEVDDSARTITFYLEAQVPPDRQVAETILWYDTEVGHQLLRTSGSTSDRIRLDHRIDATQEGLTTTLAAGEAWNGTLDYWWQLRDTAGESVRAGQTVTLSAALQALVTTPTPEPPPVGFTWAVSESQHFQLQYVPGSAAERDRFQVGAMAEAALARTSSVLEVEFDGQMTIYLVPRVFWQGGAAYGDKVQLISYLDRNYTGVEIWSYFTHEGTHALAQDILQPKENGGGPDGVLVEGLAVWASGGHYREEPIDDWTAVILASGEYIPLADLRAGPFYEFQHEISYLEGASFVKFLVEQGGLDTLKDLYGNATNNPDDDRALVQRLYGRDYAQLEDTWLAALAERDPTPEQALAWHLQVRSFDLMRRYETELDPDARILPPSPTEWTSDTLQIFLNRAEDPLNVVLETAFIAVQDRLHGGDLAGAEALLNDVEAALNAGGQSDRPSLQAREAIVDLVAAQDRAIRRADSLAYEKTLDPASTLSSVSKVEKTLSPSFVAYKQEMVRLDIADDSLRAEGIALLHAEVADGSYVDNGQLFAVAFTDIDGQWLMSSREHIAPVLTMPPPIGD
jgi:hypothetical protein